MLMTKENKIQNIMLLLFIIMSVIMGVLNKSYLVTGMYVITLLVIGYMFKDDGIYDLFYGVLITSTIYDYVLYMPGRENLYIFHIALGLFTIGTFIKLIKNPDIFKKISKFAAIIIGIWFIYICASFFWALNRGLAVKYIAIYILMFCFIGDLAVYNINKERFAKTVKLLIGFTSFIIIIGFIEVLLGHQLPVKHHYDGLPMKDSYDYLKLMARPLVFSFNINNLAATLSIMIPISMFQINKSKSIAAKVWLIVICSISFILVALTISRTGIVAMAFSIGVYLLYNIITFKVYRFKGLLYSVILIAAFTLAFTNGYRLLNVKSAQNIVQQTKTQDNDLVNKMDKLMDDQVSIGGDGSVNERLTIIHDVISDAVENKKILGNGAGNVYQLLVNKNNTYGVYNPHCYPIEILGDFGVVGVLIYGVYYLYLLIGNLVLGIKKKNIYCIEAVTGLIAFAPASFGPSSITYVFSYWILMGFAISTIQVAKQDNNY
ncbi:MAG: O-antigen ligase family protein [Clostridium butyricum]|nr:O-antigen ligase family protein [Clostridium butyricum]